MVAVNRITFPQKMIKHHGAVGIKLIICSRRRASNFNRIRPMDRDLKQFNILTAQTAGLRLKSKPESEDVGFRKPE